MQLRILKSEFFLKNEVIQVRLLARYGRGNVLVLFMHPSFSYFTITSNLRFSLPVISEQTRTVYHHSVVSALRYYLPFQSIWFSTIVLQIFLSTEHAVSILVFYDVIYLIFKFKWFAGIGSPLILNIIVTKPCLHLFAAFIIFFYPP